MVMANGLRSRGLESTLYFVLLVIIGDYILLNVFLAILISNLSSEEEEQGGGFILISLSGTFLGCL